ncbi:hypothetical protein CTEN210_09734 [Chaetoceros tenuissimus]|uniref:Uncharacterized protein n=1 Tax=Chaetoceros tenuissimus TaxID=426638 RepID=A0AAD3CW50_9STRA|nr:hypothetical protein CTEN210_09734 [Chaetoceros tenuissimus]
MSKRNVNQMNCAEKSNETSLPASEDLQDHPLIRKKVNPKQDTRKSLDGSSQQSYITINNLPSDAIKNIFSYIGEGHYHYVAPVCKFFFHNSKQITPAAASSSIEIAEDAFRNAAHEFQRKLLGEIVERNDFAMLDLLEKRNVFDLFSRDDNYDYIFNHTYIFEMTARHSGSDRLFRLHCRMVENMDQSTNPLCDHYASVVDVAAEYGQLDFIDSIHFELQRECYEAIECTFQDLFSTAARGGHLNIIKWGIEYAELEFRKEDYIDDAVQSGNLELVKWFRDQNTPWTKYSLTNAVESGNIQLVKYLLDNECPRSEAEACSAAVDHDCHKKATDILILLHQRGIPWDSSTCTNAARWGNLDALIYARSKACPWTKYTLQKAVTYGHFHIVEYCLKHSCPSTSQLYLDAISRDGVKSVNMLKLLRRYSVPVDESTCTEAAKHGSLETLKWARSEGFPWNEDTFREAVTREETDLSLIQYCIDNHCPFNAEHVYDYAFCFPVKETIPILEILHKNGISFTTNACAKASSKGDLTSLKWLMDRGCPSDERVCNEAVREDNYKILVYAHRNGCPLSKETYAYTIMPEYGLDGDYFKVPSRDRCCSDKIFEYLERHNCPKPDASDWSIVKPSDYDYDSDDSIHTDYCGSCDY